MSYPVVNVGLVSNLFVRQMNFKNAGDVEISHAHSFDHMTLLAKGKLKVAIGNEETVFVAPQIIFIKANIQHTLTAETDSTVAYCIHALRDNNGDIISEDMVPKSEALFEILNNIVVK